MSFFSILRRIREYKLKKTNPVKHANKIGVDSVGLLYIYGEVSWGTEPWIIKLGENVHITHGVTFITHDGGTLLFRSEYPDIEITKPIIIGDNVYIGTNATILPGVKIGSNVVIGACSVVTKDVPSNTVVAGNPAKVIKTIEVYKKKMISESLGLGHLKGQDKDEALKEYYKNRGII